MSTKNQFSTLQFENNLVLNSLNKEDKSQLVYDFSGGYNTLDYVISMSAKPREITGKDGIFQKPIMGSSAVVAQVASNATSGSNLRVNFSDPTFQNFRLQEVISDGTANQNQGRVIDKGPGYVILEPTPHTGAWSTSSHFVAGTYAVSMYIAAGNRGSTGVESLYEYPEYVSNQTSIIRESSDLFRRDKSQSWVKYAGDYWYSAQDVLAVKRFARALELRALFSGYGTTSNSAIGGAVNYSMGLKAAIKDPKRGGIYTALTNAMTQADFENFISKIANRNSADSQEITLVMGRGALRRVQSFTSSYIQYAGQANTFGGKEVKGLDVRKYSIAGINVNMVMLPLFNDTDRFGAMSTIPGLSESRMSYTIIALDTNSYEAVGGGEVLPAMEKVYFGDQEICYDYIGGVAMGNSSSTFTPGKTTGAVNDRDGISFQIYSDCAYDFMANRMGWLELAY